MKLKKINKYTPVYPNLFEIVFGGNISNDKLELLTEYVSSYVLSRSQLNIRFNLSVEDFADILLSYNSVDKVEINYHDKSGDIFHKKLFDVKCVNYEMSGDYSIRDKFVEIDVKYLIK